MKSFQNMANFKSFFRPTNKVITKKLAWTSSPRKSMIETKPFNQSGCGDAHSPLFLDNKHSWKIDYVPYWPTFTVANKTKLKGGKAGGDLNNFRFKTAEA